MSAKSVPKSKTRAVLSAEILSFRTHKPIGNFPKNVRVTSLDPSVIIESENQIEENRAVPIEGEPKPKARTPKTGSTRVEKPKDKTVELALEQIAGILIKLNLEQRHAVIKKACGAFNIKVQTGNQDNSKKSEKPSKAPGKPVAKEGFNEKFAATLEGQLLDETARYIRKASKSAALKPSSELYDIHKALLGEKVRFRTSGTKMVPFVFTEPPKVILDRLMRSDRAIKTHLSFPQPLDDNTRTLILRAGMCLLQGKVVQEGLLPEGIIPPEASWEAVTPLVPRTERETEERAASILASKKTRSEKKKASETQKPASKRARLNGPAPEANPEVSEVENPSGMEMESEDEE